MTTTPTRLTILFCPLLSTITECLQLPQPEYHVFDQATHNVSVTVRSFDGTIDGVYVGGTSATVECSSEKAAQLAISDLKKTYDIYIIDITALRHQESERCTNLWRLKRQELQRQVKGLPKIESVEEFDCPEISHLHVVHIDFVHLLNTLKNKLHVDCSDIEVIEHTQIAFTAWVSIIHHKSDYGCTSIYGEIAGSYITAKQELATKVITYLVPIYNLQIIDANSGDAKFNTNDLVCENIKEKCRLLKEPNPLNHRRFKAQGSVDRVTLPLTPAKLSVRALRPNKQVAIQKTSHPKSTSTSTTASKRELFK